MPNVLIPPLLDTTDHTCGFQEVLPSLSSSILIHDDIVAGSEGERIESLRFDAYFILFWYGKRGEMLPLNTSIGRINSSRITLMLIRGGHTVWDGNVVNADYPRHIAR